MAERTDKLYDVRLIERNIRKQKVTRADVNKLREGLEDMTEKASYVTVELPTAKPATPQE